MEHPSDDDIRATCAGPGAPTTVVYGLDIETDTTVDGLDTAVAAVVAVAVAGDAGDAVLTNPDEAQLLREVSGLLAALPAGVLVTWNGATFDLPFLDTRARRHGIDLGLHLQVDPRARHPYADDPYHRGTFQGSWRQHRHVDAFRVYRRDVGCTLGLSCGLKALAGLVGLDTVSVDPSRINHLSPHQLRAYVASDARCARELALRRWATAGRAIDPVVLPDASTAAPPLTRTADLTPTAGLSPMAGLSRPPDLSQPVGTLR